jgi:CxxC motif-containing protein
MSTGKAFTCIVCPNGCRLEAEQGPSGISVRGNQCKRGAAFARAEMTCPTRTLTTTVRTVFPWSPVLPVRTDGEIPKGRIGDLMALLRGLVIREPLGIGEAAAENVLGLGRNIIVTSNILVENSEGGP